MWWQSPKVKPVQTIILEQDRQQTRETIERLENVTIQIKLVTTELKELIAQVAKDEGITIEEIIYDHPASVDQSPE